MKRILILGGGFGGVYAALTLEKRLKAELDRGEVELGLQTRRAGATADAALLSSGERLPTRTLVSTVPSGPNPLVAALRCRMDRGRIATTPYLELPEHPGVWAVGDCAFIIDAKTGQPARPRRSTPRGRRAAWPRTSRRAGTARPGARSPSRRWARWAPSATARPLPRSSA
jgi:NADH dehydrogenase FAD-containing subunit